MSEKLSYDRVERFTKVALPQEIEDEMLNVFAKYSIDHDMNTDDLPGYFEDLSLPSDLYNLVRKEDLVVERTNIIDFDKILRCTYYLLIYIDNEDIIDNFWEMLLKNSGRMKKFPNVKLRNHVLSIKDLQKVSNVIGMTDGSGIIEMMSCATHGSRVYLSYLDFANILGRLGLLRFQIGGK